MAARETLVVRDVIHLYAPFQGSVPITSARGNTLNSVLLTRAKGKSSFLTVRVSLTQSLGFAKGLLASSRWDSTSSASALPFTHTAA